MKKIILLISFLTTIQFTYAQGDLQFNQAIRVKYTGSVTSGTLTTAGSITVPANTVWKIESGSITHTSSYVYYLSSIDLVLYIDEQILFYGRSGQQVPYSSPPIWLNPGTYPVKVAASSVGPYSFSAAISGIEFNIIP